MCTVDYVPYSNYCIIRPTWQEIAKPITGLAELPEIHKKNYWIILDYNVSSQTSKHGYSYV